jgi:hypothetical protein
MLVNENSSAEDDSGSLGKVNNVVPPQFSTKKRARKLTLITLCVAFCELFIMKSLLVIFAFIALNHALIHDLKIRNDDRSHFFIENFGFEVGGELHMTILDFQVMRVRNRRVLKLQR